MKVYVTSENQVKIEAARIAFKQVFSASEIEIESGSVPSGVREQPISCGETLQGARNRISAAAARVPADFWVGIEGGVDIGPEDVEGFTWVVIRSAQGVEGRARSGSFPLPRKLAAQIRNGGEVGELSDEIFQQHGSKKGLGTVGILTKGHLDRTHLCVDTIFLALIPFNFPELY